MEIKFQKDKNGEPKIKSIVLLDSNGKASAYGLIVPNSSEQGFYVQILHASGLLKSKYSEFHAAPHISEIEWRLARKGEFYRHKESQNQYFDPEKYEFDANGQVCAEFQRVIDMLK